MPPRKRKSQPPNHRTLKDYKSRISKHKVPFSCPMCKESVSYTQFEKHCSNQHSLNPRLECVWCQGKFSWRSTQKNKNCDHLIPCWQSFLQSKQESFESDDSESNIIPLPAAGPLTLKPMLSNLSHTDPKQDFFGHFFDDPPPPRAHDFPRPATLKKYPLTFQDESLNLALSCVQKYLELGNAAEWFHAMVRIPAYTKFMQLMDEDEGTETLPFSCWCDGGEEIQTKIRQHRHMIIVSGPPGHFVPNLWQKITIPQQDRPNRNYPSRHLIRIQDIQHLVHVLGYVSHRKSQCNFASKETNGTEKNNHFYLSESLPKDFRLPLFLQWDNGLLELIKLQCNNLNKRDLVEAPLQFKDNQWKLKIKDIPGIKLNTVIPVSKTLQPCDNPTPYFFHIIGGRKMYFESNPDLVHLSPEEWVQKQAELGNVFFHVIGEEYWTPRPFYQSLISTFKPIVDRNKELETENVTLKVENVMLKEENLHRRVECAELKSENAELRRRCENLMEQREGNLSDDKNIQIYAKAIARIFN